MTEELDGKVNAIEYNILVMDVTDRASSIRVALDPASPPGRLILSAPPLASCDGDVLKGDVVNAAVAHPPN